jgi:outer membrane protein OmpA-like peptidoglycan-associated protein
MSRRAITLSLVLSWGCAGRRLPPEIVSLQALRAEPSLSGAEKDAFYLLAAADDLLVRARREWDHHSDEMARRDAIMGQIKMKTALAILQAERAKARLASIGVELVAAQNENKAADQALAEFQEEDAMKARLASVSATIAGERKTLSQQVETEKKRAASERQQLLEQLAVEKRHFEALEALRDAELELKTADTVMAAEYAQVKYTAAAKMLQDAHGRFDAGNWDEAIARAATARSEAMAALDAARPLYEQAEQVKVAMVRDRAMEEAALAITGISTRFERQNDLQKLVLVLPDMFVRHQGGFTPEGAKALDAVRDLLKAFPSYPLRISGFADDPGKPGDGAVAALARANAVYWALVARGIDPRRMSIDSGAIPQAMAGAPTSGAGSERLELSILYHVLQH